MKSIVAIGLLELMLASSPTLAHHSTAAEFDTAKPLSFDGTVTKVEWMNPHIYVNIETRGVDGKPVVYRVEGNPPNSLYRRGWRKDSLKTGDKVSVTGIRAKNPESKNVGSAVIKNTAGISVYQGEAPGHDTPPP